MKLFECAEGTLINPNNVTHCKQTTGEGKYIVRFNFVGGKDTDILFNHKTQAVNQLIAYQQFCEEQI